MAKLTRHSGADAARAAGGRFATRNPGTRPGTRHRATTAAMALLEGEAEAPTRRCVELALAGDTTALRLCLERLLPKSRAVRLPLPLRTLADLEAATDAVSDALADGTVVLDEVATLAGLIETRRRLLETAELERRLAALEQGDGSGPASACAAAGAGAEGLRARARGGVVAGGVEACGRLG